VALFNRSGSQVTASTTTSAIGFIGGSGCSYTVKSLWDGTTSTTTGTITATLPAHGSAVFRLIPSTGCGAERPTGQIFGLAGKCIEDSGGSTTNGNPLTLFGCTGSPDQSWSLPSGGTVRALGKCMAVQNNSTSPGAALVLRTCDGSSGEQWSYKLNGELVNPASTLCVDVPHGNSADGTNLQISTCGNNQRKQIWSLPSRPF
jgi:alpha-galactosidase